MQPGMQSGVPPDRVSGGVSVSRGWKSRRNGVGLCFRSEIRIPNTLNAKAVAGPSIMTSEQKQQLRDKVGREIERLTRDIEALKELTRPVPPGADSLDEVSRMDAIQNKSVNEVALATARKRLAGLEYAVKRLGDDDPEYGYCVECGEAIPFARLMSMPEASRCVNCAE